MSNIDNSGPDLSGTVEKKGALTYRVRPPVGEGEHPLLLMLHGRGANEGDIYELVPYVDRRVMVVAPRGPQLYDNSPRGAFMWFAPLQGAPPSDTHFDNALEHLFKLVDELVAEYPVDRKQIFLGGFSQGAAMSYVASLARPELIAGVIAHSGFLPLVPKLKPKLSALKDKPYFIAHGSADPMVGPERAREAVKVLEEAGAGVTFKEYPLEHATSPQSRRDLADWLHKHLSLHN